MTLAELLASWREEAKILRRNGATDFATLKELDAPQLELCLREVELEHLTPTQAAQESGYSEAHLRRLQTEGKLRNLGTSHRPRYARGDLPRKPRRQRLVLTDNLSTNS